MKISHYAVLQNAIKNNEKLAFAKSVLSKEQFERLYKSYRNLFWFQIMPVIVLAVAVVLELIFIPSENVPNGVASLKETIIIFEAAFFMVPIFPLWLIISQFTVGKLWRRYSKWYEKSTDRYGIYDIFD